MYYQPSKDSDRFCSIVQMEQRIDSAGRAMAQLHGMVTTSGMNPFEYLNTIYKKELERGTHFEVGLTVNSDEETRSLLEKATISSSRINQMFFQLINIGVGYSSREELAAISKNKEFLSRIKRWALPSGDNFHYSKITGNKTDYVIYGFPGRVPTYFAIPTYNIERGMISKFGNKDAKLHILLDSELDIEKKNYIILYYSTNQLEGLTPEYQKGLKWIEAVGTPEEIEKARKYTKIE